ANVALTRRRGFKIFHIVLADQSGAIRCTWMNQAFLADVLKPHLRVVVFGEVKLDSSGLHFLNPEYEIVSLAEAGPEPDARRAAPRDETVHTGRIVPFYEKTGTVTPNMQRKLVRLALDQVPAAIPERLREELRARLALLPRRLALEQAHFPANDASVERLNAFRTPPQQR